MVVGAAMWGDEVSRLGVANRDEGVDGIFLLGVRASDLGILKSQIWGEEESRR